MPLNLNGCVALLLLQLALLGQRPLTAAETLPRPCPTCRGAPARGGLQQRRLPADVGTAAALAAGKPCGVYTLGCAEGLRCAPPEDHPRPLQALLEGRGACSDSSRISPTTRIHTVVPGPAPSEDAEKTPCRKLLVSIMKALSSRLFQSHHDIYMPNCDKRGFFRRKQCHSSRGTQRGTCWCVDENGLLMPTYTKQDGILICDGS